MSNVEIGFLGLGLLGTPMAMNLQGRGHRLRVWNRTAEKADALVAAGAVRAETPAAAVPPGGIVISALWDDAAIDAVVESPDFFARLRGGLHVSTSTIAPEASRRLAARHAEQGATYVEAPIFGRPEAAAARQLWIPLAGPAAAKARVRPLLDDLGAQGVFDFGEAIGAAVAVKIAGNFLIGAASRSLAEAVAMMGPNVDARAGLAMLTSTLFAAPIYQSYGKRLVERAPVHPQAAAILRKDVGIFRDVAEAAGVAHPIADRLLELVDG